MAHFFVLSEAGLSGCLDLGTDTGLPQSSLVVL